jgi:hypothetical protein
VGGGIPFPSDGYFYTASDAANDEKGAKMLPTVAAVLPAEKGNETLVKWGLLPCCRFSGPLSINRAFPAGLSANRQKRVHKN